MSTAGARSAGAVSRGALCSAVRAGRWAPDVDRDRLRDRDRITSPAHDRDRVRDQDRTHVPDHAKLGDKNIYGGELMSVEERNQYREQLRLKDERKAHRTRINALLVTQGIALMEARWVAT